MRNECDLLVSDSPNYSVISDPERSQFRMRDATRRDVMLTKQAHVTRMSGWTRIHEMLEAGASDVKEVQNQQS